MLELETAGCEQHLRYQYKYINKQNQLEEGNIRIPRIGHSKRVRGNMGAQMESYGKNEKGRATEPIEGENKGE